MPESLIIEQLQERANQVVGGGYTTFLDDKITEIEKAVVEQQGYCLRQRRVIEAAQADLHAAEENRNRLEVRWQTLKEIQQVQPPERPVEEPQSDA